MSEATNPPHAARLIGAADLRASINGNGSLRRFDCGEISLLLFPGTETEGGPANLYLRRHGRTIESVALLGPRSPGRFRVDAAGRRLVGAGEWQGIRYELVLILAADAAAWFWHLRLVNASGRTQRLDLTYAQDLALAPYGALRMNEYYVSQYVDHTPLQHAAYGCVIASRQNQPVAGRHPWCVIGSLRRGASYATDALQFHGLAGRLRAVPPGLETPDLASRRLQHEHSMVVIRDAVLQLEAGASTSAGFFGHFLPDHPDASGTADLAYVDRATGLPEAIAPGDSAVRTDPDPPADVPSLFVSADALPARDPDTTLLHTAFPQPWRHTEPDGQGGLLSFFDASGRHVVLRAKELRVLRPHGRILRSGRQTTPAERALTSTVWMGGVFHSLLTQGHVNINRCLSTLRGYLGLFRAQGQRVFAEIDGRWRLLELPSAFAMSDEGCQWLYRHDGGLIDVRAEPGPEPHEMRLSLTIIEGAPSRFLIVHHLALDGDDGATQAPVPWRREGARIVLTPPPDSDLGRRFPDGAFHLDPAEGTQFDRIGGDELLFRDERSRGEPYLCLRTTAAVRAGLVLRGALLAAEARSPLQLPPGAPPVPRLSIRAPADCPLAPEVTRLAEIAPWLAHDAWVHYLAPRGLEQFSGGGWGTRDVCQGPVELLLATGLTDSLRDLLLRVMAAQNPGGDWPQWFMFFERERTIRADDSHGDIVFWPLLALAQYLQVSGDAGVLEQPVPFFDANGAIAAGTATVWEHVRRALAVIEHRVVPGTKLAAYGHGDWNDSLQPVDPRLREQLCSAWTVTLQVQTLRQLAGALRAVGRPQHAPRLEHWADQVAEEFRQRLLGNGVLAGYAQFEPGGGVQLLLHPDDRTTGVRYSALAMVHAILEDLLPLEQVTRHLALIETHLTAPDGLRLFDRPLPYRGGPQRLFQRAETATFFGREIGLMYTHAHLRYAQALARVGDAGRFLRALCQANPIGIRSTVPTAAPRQANCYFSSSDAAFDDRYQARSDYARVLDGSIAFEGGWRVYSSGAGIALGLIVRRFLGLDRDQRYVRVDPVIPHALDGMQADLTFAGHPLQVRYRIGPAGCGVTAVRLNRTAMPFVPEANPYRRGAALVAGEAFDAALTDGLNIMEIDTG